MIIPVKCFTCGKVVSQRGPLRTTIEPHMESFSHPASPVTPAKPGASAARLDVSAKQADRRALDHVAEIDLDLGGLVVAFHRQRRRAVHEGP